MKKLLVAGIGSLMLSIFNTQNANAAIYTHTLNYNNSDHGHSLQGTVTFDDSNVIASNYPNGVYSFGPGNFITNISFTYTNNTTNNVFTLTSNDFNDTVFARVRIEYTGVPDFSRADLTTQLTDLAFRFDRDGSVRMSDNSSEFELEVKEGEVDNDFELSSITYHSPGPLPIFGLLTAFSSMKKLKRKYTNREELIVN